MVPVHCFFRGAAIVFTGTVFARDVPVICSLVLARGVGFAPPPHTRFCSRVTRWL